MNAYFASRIWKLGHGRTLELGPKAVLMGILNVTPDSFSDGGKFAGADQAIEQANAMFNEGAQIIDIGGESTRPGAKAVDEHEEQVRILPVIEALSAHEDMIISVDTYRASTAQKAVELGAHIINDVWGFQKDKDLANVAAKTQSGVCAMHTGRERTKAADVIEDQVQFLQTSLEILYQANIADEAIILDPGFGFAKDEHENIELLARFEELHQLGYPLLVGTSRKRFIGHFAGQEANSRDVGTAATSVIARQKGGHIFRVHDVAINRDALAMTNAMLDLKKEG